MTRAALALSAYALFAVSCATLRQRLGWTPAPVDFATQIQPTLEVRCLQCHNSELGKAFAGLNLETRELAMTTGRSAPVIRPGDAEGSLLYQVLKLGIDHPVAMPPSPDKVMKETLRDFRNWIDQGADWPEDLRLRPPA